MKNDEKGFALIIAIGVISGLFVAGTGTAVASNSSKPGDALYSIDRSAENLQLALAFTDGNKKEAYASLAQERLDEIKALYADDTLDSSSINDALSDFEEHKTRLADLSDDDGTVDEHEKELANSLESKKTGIDKKAESQQKSLENQREGLKKQYEQAVKNGDTALAATLKAKIDGFETLLKQNEQQREDNKQVVEKEEETQKQQAESDKKAEELRLEAEKKAAETR